jgi:hypothetical protein
MLAICNAYLIICLKETAEPFNSETLLALVVQGYIYIYMGIAWEGVTCSRSQLKNLLN